MRIKNCSVPGVLLYPNLWASLEAPATAKRGDEKKIFAAVFMSAVVAISELCDLVTTIRLMIENVISENQMLGSTNKRQIWTCWPTSACLLPFGSTVPIHIILRGFDCVSHCLSSVSFHRFTRIQVVLPSGTICRTADCLSISQICDEQFEHGDFCVSTPELPLYTFLVDQKTVSQRSMLLRMPPSVLPIHRLYTRRCHRTIKDLATFCSILVLVMGLFPDR